MKKNIIMLGGITVYTCKNLNKNTIKTKQKRIIRRCYNYIFILDLTPGVGKDNSKTRRETFKAWDLARLILKFGRYFF